MPCLCEGCTQAVNSLVRGAPSPSPPAVAPSHIPRIPAIKCLWQQLFGISVAAVVAVSVAGASDSGSDSHFAPYPDPTVHACSLRWVSPAFDWALLPALKRAHLLANEILLIMVKQQY